VAEDFYTWTAQKEATYGKYADAHMKLVVLPADNETGATLAMLSSEGTHSMGMNCTEVEAGGVITPMEDACYELHFDARMWQSLFLINTTGTSHAAIFTQHSPTEFERDAHYLKDDHGDDIAALFRLSPPTVALTTFTLILDGDVASFDVPSFISSIVSLLDGVDASAISVNASSASVRVSVIISSVSVAAATEVESTLGSYLANPAVASLAFGETVVRIESAVATTILFPTSVTSYVRVTHSKPWGDAIGASFIVNIVTLIGVVIWSTQSRTLRAINPRSFEAYVQSFSAGALLATSCFLLLFESTHYVAAAVEWGEVGQNWRWGTCILAGFLVAGVLDGVVALITGEDAHAHAPSTSTASTTEVKIEMPRDGNGSGSGSSGHMVGESLGMVEGNLRPWRIRAGVLVGDFLHNFCDGFFVAVGFRFCGTSRGWSIAAGAVIHELAQELADYILLTGKGGLSPLVALVLNFISGLSVVLGAIIIFSVDISNEAVGLLLAFSSGVYLHIACAECTPAIYAHAKTGKERLICFAIFTLGAVAIGLVLFDHSHCSLSEPNITRTITVSVDGSITTGLVVAEQGDSHAGHNH